MKLIVRLEGAAGQMLSPAGIETLFKGKDWQAKLVSREGAVTTTASGGSTAILGHLARKVSEGHGDILCITTDEGRYTVSVID